MRYDKWNISSSRPEAAERLMRGGVPPLPALVLSARGCSAPEEAENLIRHDTGMLHDPFLLRDMDRAVARIHTALAHREVICVFGDYDVDGITSTCLLTSCLTAMGAEVIPYVPNRLTEGYSLNPDALMRLRQAGVSLIITVDCGITNTAETLFAHSLGIDVVITDHHECKEALPQASAVVNPRRPDCTYPFPMLAGVGVALKLALALTAPQDRSQVLREYIDLAAVGTVADVMELTGENRAIVSMGLEQLNQNPRPGLRALLREIGWDKKPVTASAISFSLAPRINAAGRMGQPELAMELLLTHRTAEANLAARQLCAMNRDRQAVEGEIYDNCQDFLARNPQQAQGAIVLAGTGWHQGVVGIVASRLSERYHVPTFMICLENGMGKGSCRSWGGFNLFHALEQCADLLVGFGGHDLAAGFTIQEKMIPAFRKRVSGLASLWRAEHPGDTALNIDVLLPDAALLNQENISSLAVLEPYGAGNPMPVFALESVTVANFSQVGGGKHTRLQLTKNGVTFDAIFFSVTPRDVQLSTGGQLDIAFYPQINDFRGRRTVQLQLCDCKSSHSITALNQQLYRRYRSGTPLTRPELDALIPERPDFVAVWRYLSSLSDPGDYQESPTRLSQKIARSSGQRADVGRTMICLEVFRERGLIELRGGPDRLSITVHKTDHKVDLDASEILVRLRRQWADDTQGG